MFCEKGRKLHLREGMSWKEKQIAVEMARLFGFQSESVVFPIISKELGETIPTEFAALDKFKEIIEIQTIPEEYMAASEAAKPVPDFDWRRKRGLETLFGCGHILKDENLDLLPDKMDVHFILPKDCDVSLLSAACTFAFRMGMETTAYEGILLRSEECSGNLIIFEKAKQCAVKYEEKEGGVLVHVTGSGERLEHFVEEFCTQLPMQGPFNTWTDSLQEIIDSMSMKNLDGQLAYTEAFANPGAEVFCSPEIEERREELESQFSEVTFTNYKEKQKIYEKEYNIPWETETLKDVLKSKIYPTLKKGDRVRILAALSEGIGERKVLSDEIVEQIDNTGATSSEISILCAYKQGYSWLEENVVPQIIKGGKAVRVDVKFKPFLPEGVTEWTDEDGATPSYHNVGNNPDKWYDLPIRYLQELYPAEDMLAEKLQMNRERIAFHVYEGNEDITYEVNAYDIDENILYEGTYKAVCAERAYLDAYPQMGKVHPSTGYVKVWINEELRLDERIATDVEQIWELYQKEVLVDLRAYIEKSLGEGISVENQPFFAQLRIEAEVSEPEFRLPSREDLFTTLDGLHEDIYFAGADYFKNLGTEKAGVIMDAPGLILPVLKQHRGKPYMKVTLYDQMAKKPMIQNVNNAIIAKGQRQDIQAWLAAIEDTEEGKKAVVQIEGADHKLVVAYANLLQKGLLDMGKKLYGIHVLELVSPSGAYRIPITPAKEQEKDLDIRDIDIGEKELIGYEKYMEIIGQLKRVAGIQVYRTAVSYTGREIYAVEMLPESEGYRSRTKRITRYPSQIVNARHHANEVSGTNAAFMLIKTLLTNAEYKELTNQVNLVIVPMENVDGAAIHFELQKEHPNWKLHVARFNAIGKEFYYEHFKSDTIHTEAMGLTRLFHTFLPDIIVDNHGVPSHEWEQQFSGYTSPSYKGFWLPRSLIYGYFWTIEGEEYKSNYAVNKKMEDVIADSLGEDDEITAWNQEWARQFEKFAHGWMPRLFPADYYKDMINYWIPFAFDPDHRYPSIRFPWITTVAYTSEVADETAQGEYLYLCARTHLNHDLATLKMLEKCTCVFKNIWNISEDSIETARIRLRPIIV